MKYLICGCIITLLIATSCGKDCLGSMYSFNTKAKVYPDKDSIAIGDTIWLEVNTPTSLPDITSGKTVDYSDAANLGIAIQLSSLHGGSISETGAEICIRQFWLSFNKRYAERF